MCKHTSVSYVLMLLFILTNKNEYTKKNKVYNLIGTYLVHYNFFNVLTGFGLGNLSGSLALGALDGSDD